jgi:hypothetical protein
LIRRADMTSDARKRAVAKYDAQNTKQIKLKLNLRSDHDILERLEEVGNVQGYIKQLIREDIERCGIPTNIKILNKEEHMKKCHPKKI